MHWAVKYIVNAVESFLNAEPGTAITHPKKWYGSAKRMSMRVKQHVMPNRLMSKFYIPRLYDCSTGCMRTRKDWLKRWKPILNRTFQQSRARTAIGYRRADATIEIWLEGISESQATESDWWDYIWWRDEQTFQRAKQATTTDADIRGGRGSESINQGMSWWNHSGTKLAARYTGTIWR